MGPNKTYNGSTSFYALDGLGSPVALINTSGTVIATYSYVPYGYVTVGNPTGSAAANLNPYRFAGGMLDRNTGYVKYGQRYYDPFTGRFTQQDSIEIIGDPGRGNRYTYASDNPVNYVDPTGQVTASDIGAVVGGVAAAFIGAAVCTVTAVVGCLAVGAVAGAGLTLSGGLLGAAFTDTTEEVTTGDVLLWTLGGAAAGLAGGAGGLL